MPCSCAAWHITSLAQVSAIHDAGYVIGDLNQSNILVTSRGLVTFIDTDSFQVKEDGRRYLCLVRTPEYVAPELVGKDLAGRRAGPNARPLRPRRHHLSTLDGRPTSVRWRLAEWSRRFATGGGVDQTRPVRLLGVLLRARPSNRASAQGAALRSARSGAASLLRAVLRCGSPGTPVNGPSAREWAMILRNILEKKRPPVPDKPRIVSVASPDRQDLCKVDIRGSKGCR